MRAEGNTETQFPHMHCCPEMFHKCSGGTAYENVNHCNICFVVELKLRDINACRGHMWWVNLGLS